MTRVLRDDYERMLEEAGDDAEREVDEAALEETIAARLAALAEDGQEIGEAEQAGRGPGQAGAALATIEHVGRIGQAGLPAGRAGVAHDGQRRDPAPDQIPGRALGSDLPAPREHLDGDARPHRGRAFRSGPGPWSNYR